MPGGVPHHLQQLFMPSEFLVKANAVRVSSYYLELKAGDLLRLEPLQSIRQKTTSNSSAPMGFRDKNLADSPHRCGAEIRRQSANSTRDEVDNLAIPLAHHDVSET